MAADDHALVVGINAYSKLRPLRGAEADAAAVQEWLTNPDGGDVPSANVTTIVSSDYPTPAQPALARPMTDDIRAELERLVDDAGATLQLGRRLYLYMSGHGFSPSIDESALLMANASTRVLHSLPGVRYANLFRESTIFEEVVLWMDCCRDHYDRPPVVDVGLPHIAVPGTDAPFFFGFATKWSLESRESFDPATKSVRGHFTRALLEGLAQPDATSSRVAAYIAGRLPELAPRHRYYEPEFRCGKSIRFRPAAAAPAVRLEAELRLVFGVTDPALTATVTDNTGALVAQRPADGKPWRLTVPRGLYAIRRTDGTQQLVSAGTGQVIALNV